jgi:hypothetical protein
MRVVIALVAISFLMSQSAFAQGGQKERVTQKLLYERMS